MSHDALKDLLALLQLTEQLADGRSLEDALRAVTDTALAVLPGDHASIRMVDASRTQLLCTARSGTGRETATLPLRTGEGIAGWVLEHGKPARVIDVHEDPRFKAAPGQGFAIASMVVEPLVSEGAAIGVLSVSSPEVSAFSATDEVLARLLANCSVGPIQRARLERLAVTDDLTLAFNGRYLASRMLEEMERARRSGDSVSVLLLDLDHFKQVNDTHGHAVGDQVLRVFVERVRAATRRVDILVRRGGEEFVLLMPGTTSMRSEDDRRPHLSQRGSSARSRSGRPVSRRRSPSGWRRGTARSRRRSSSSARMPRCTARRSTAATGSWLPDGGAEAPVEENQAELCCPPAKPRPA